LRDETDPCIFNLFCARAKACLIALYKSHEPHPVRDLRTAITDIVMLVLVSIIAVDVAVILILDAFAIEV
jgi:hypothetical protein